MESYRVMCTEFQFYEMKKVLEMDGADGCREITQCIDRPQFVKLEDELLVWTGVRLLITVVTVSFYLMHFTFFSLPCPVLSFGNLVNLL